MANRLHELRGLCLCLCILRTVFLLFCTTFPGENPGCQASDQSGVKRLDRKNKKECDIQPVGSKSWLNQLLLLVVPIVSIVTKY